jgi:hypothetical protein
MIKWLKQMLLINAVLLPIMIFFPAVCWTLALHPLPMADRACFLFGPLSAGFWVLLYSQWSSAMVWHRMGRLRQWREDHGGICRTVRRACGWLLFGIVLSFAAEVIYTYTFHWMLPDGTLAGFGGLAGELATA